jgi:glycosyltransferase involved in cell wall biosynthesis
MSALRILTLSSLFPSAVRPMAGLFVRERMTRVGGHVPVTFVSPQPWFPFQSVIRKFRPGYRPEPARYEKQGEFDVYFPRFFALPGALRRLDGLFIALGCLPLLLRLKRSFRFNVIDAHFAYPDGYAASLLGRWLGVPVVVTLRGTEPGHVLDPALRRRIVSALSGATRVLSVSASLRNVALNLGIPAGRCHVVGNGVDLARFRAMPRDAARASLGIPADAKVLISVGGLVERKGFHRVIEVLPALVRRFPGLRYLVVGGGSPEGDMGPALRDQVERLGLGGHVLFLGPLAPDDLSTPLSAADAFVLATRNEGWANVFLEAMAIGLPVVATDVGGNREVVADDRLGIIVPFGDSGALANAIAQALESDWDRADITAYARAHSWDRRAAELLVEFEGVVAMRGAPEAEVADA